MEPARRQIQIACICLALRDAGQACALVTRLEAQKAEAVRAALLVRDPQAAAAFEYRPVPQSWRSAPARRQSPRAIATSRWRARVPATCTAPRRRPLPPRRCSDRAWCACMMWGLRASIASWRIGRKSQAPAGAVAVAGMEGALASVVGGMAACPVIAVPTSVGYGASFGGVAALLAMLDSCASGVSVVNIDNGFGAGYQAHMIERAGSRHGEGEPDVKILKMEPCRERHAQPASGRYPAAKLAARVLGSVLKRRPMPQASLIAIINDSGEVLATIDGLVVSPAVRDRCVARYLHHLGRSRGCRALGCAVEQTHFHEVG